VQWLDGQITEESIQQYIKLAKRGNWTAIRALETLQLRISEARKQQQELEKN
jgi:hypothetical protein